MIIRDFGILGHMPNVGIPTAIVHGGLLICEQGQNPLCRGRLRAAAYLRHRALVQGIDWAISLTDQFFPHKKFKYTVPHKSQCKGAELAGIAVRVK